MATQPIRSTLAPAVNGADAQPVHQAQQPQPAPVGIAGTGQSTVIRDASEFRLDDARETQIPDSWRRAGGQPSAIGPQNFAQSTIAQAAVGYLVAELITRPNPLIGVLLGITQRAQTDTTEVTLQPQAGQTPTAIAGSEQPAIVQSSTPDIIAVALAIFGNPDERSAQLTPEQQRLRVIFEQRMAYNQLRFGPILEAMRAQEQQKPSSGSKPDAGSTDKKDDGKSLARFGAR